MGTGCVNVDNDMERVPYVKVLELNVEMGRALGEAILYIERDIEE